MGPQKDALIVKIFQRPVRADLKNQSPGGYMQLVAIEVLKWLPVGTPTLTILRYNM